MFVPADNKKKKKEIQYVEEDDQIQEQSSQEEEDDGSSIFSKEDQLIQEVNDQSPPDGMQGFDRGETFNMINHYELPKEEEKKDSFR